MPDVHTEHCCLKHGCKYNDDKCTVMTKAEIQSYPCQDCKVMTFKRERPIEPGFYWCYIKYPRHPELAIGQVKSPKYATVRGVFDFDWGDWLYWGDRIDEPDQIELK